MNNNDFYFKDTPESTEFTRIYDKIYNNSLITHVKLIMLTSANVSEGKSTIIAHLAAIGACCQSKSILLMDCDMRRPRLHEFYGLPLKHGLADLYESNVPIRQVMKDTSIENLKIITAGIAHKNPANLLASAKTRQILKALRSEFELVLLDSPPVIPVSDALMLSHAVEGILVIVKAGATRKKIAKRAIELLDINKTKILGVIINNCKRIMPYYYDYSYYKYEYINKKLKDFS